MRTRCQRPRSFSPRAGTRACPARAPRADRRAAPRCRDPRPAPCRRRTRPSGSRLRSPRTRAGWSSVWTAIRRSPGRGSGPSAPPSSSARRRARAGSRSACGARRAAARRSGRAPTPPAAAPSARLGRALEVALAIVLAERLVGPRPGSSRAHPLHRLGSTLRRGSNKHAAHEGGGAFARRPACRPGLDAHVYKEGRSADRAGGVTVAHGKLRCAHVRRAAGHGVGGSRPVRV